ncbi:hypothetical protein Hanom_Chr12g01144241 [Helianthus anomalus]
MIHTDNRLSIKFQQQIRTIGIALSDKKQNLSYQEGDICSEQLKNTLIYPTVFLKTKKNKSIIDYNTLFFPCYQSQGKTTI